MIKILFGFLPWVIYFILIGHSAEQNTIAVIAALISLLVVDFRALRKKFILSWASLIFFVFLLVSTVIFKNTWINNHANILSNIALTSIIWFSLMIGKPFTLQYVREQVPPSVWQTKGFIRVNQIITIVWGGALLISTILVALHLYFMNFTGWGYQIISYAPIIGAILFTQRFPDWWRQRAIKKQLMAALLCLFRSVLN